MSDERQAEIEAAYMRGYRAALAGLKPLPGGEDRVRDARGDDEVEVERLNRALDNMRAEYMANLNAAEAQIVALRAARSPQGEDNK